jgi:hypothetical protein
MCGGPRCCSRPCWAVVLACFATFFIVAGCIVPWYIISASVDSSALSESKILINVVFWWKDFYVDVLQGDQQVDERGGHYAYSDFNMDKTGRLSLITMCLMIASGVCAVLAVIGALYICIVFVRRRILCAKLITLLLGGCGLILAVVACGYYTTLPSALKEDAQANTAFSVPISNDFWSYTSEEVDIGIPVEAKMFRGPIGWYLPLIGCVFLLISLFLVLISRNPYQYNYDILINK